MEMINKGAATRQALRVAALYIFGAAVWIVLSGWVLERLTSDSEVLVHLEQAKGIGFVLATGALLFLTMRRILKGWEVEVARREKLETELNRALSSLTGSERRLRLVVDASNDGLWDWDLKSGVCFLSPRFYEICEYAPGTVVPDWAFLKVLVHPEDWPWIEKELNQVIKGDQATISVTYRILTMSKQVKWIWGRGEVVERDAAGIALRFVGVVSDVTDQKHAESRLGESEERYRKLFELESDAILVADMATRQIIDVNQSALVLYGYSKEEFCRLRVGELSRDPEVTTESFDKREKFIPTRFHKKKNGRFFPVEISTNVIPDGGRLLMQGVIRDITERLDAENALKEHVREFKAMIELSSAGMAQAHPETGKFLRVNRALCEMVGYSEAQLLTMTVADLTHAEDREADGLAFAQLRHGETRISRPEKRLIRKDGVVIWVNVDIVMLRDQDERPLRTFATIEEITASKLAGKALAEKERLLRTYVEQSPVAIAMLDKDLCYLVASRLWRSNFHLATKELEGRSHLALFPDQGSAWQEIYARCLGGASEKGDRTEFTRADGSKAWISWDIRPWYTVDEEIGGLIITTQDLTSHIEAEHERTRLATVVEQATEAIMITDLEGILLYVNPAFERSTGYSRKEVLGKSASIVKSGKHEESFYSDIWAQLKAGRTWQGCFINKRRDGSLYEEDASISPVRDAQGKVVSFVAVKRDVSHERKLEDQLRQSQKMEAIGQLAGGIAHDFNNILTSLLIQAELISYVTNLPEEAAEGVRQVTADVRRAADLTRQLLLFSRRQVMQTKLLDLNDVVLNMARMLQRIIGEDVRLHLNLSNMSLKTRADAGMLEQVLMNLAVNARDAMKQGGTLTIETKAVEYRADQQREGSDVRAGRFVCMRVADTGGGIPVEIMPRIFEPFFTTKSEGKGTGLGLATVFGIVKQHRGWIEVDNRPGSGVAFSVILEATQEGGEDAQVKSQARNPEGSGELILIVEDEEAVRRLTRATLERSGYAVLEASDGREALALFLLPRQQKIQLVMTDLVMPGGMTGQDVARRMVIHDPTLRVIYFSGYSAEIAGRELQLSSQERFLEKPFTSERLLKTVTEVLATTKETAGRQA